MRKKLPKTLIKEQEAILTGKIFYKDLVELLEMRSKIDERAYEKKSEMGVDNT